jgi:hypothetical protein
MAHDKDKRPLGELHEEIERVMLNDIKQSLSATNKEMIGFNIQNYNVFVNAAGMSAVNERGRKMPVHPNPLFPQNTQL